MICPKCKQAAVRVSGSGEWFCYPCQKPLVERATISVEAFEKAQAANTGEALFMDAWDKHTLGEPYEREYCFSSLHNSRSDFAFPSVKIGIEVDGQVHRHAGRFAGDVVKHNRYISEGWIYFRVTPDMLRTAPAQFCYMVLEAILRRRGERMIDIPKEAA